MFVLRRKIKPSVGVQSNQKCWHRIHCNFFERNAIRTKRNWQHNNRKRTHDNCESDNQDERFNQPNLPENTNVFRLRWRINSRHWPLKVCKIRSLNMRSWYIYINCHNCMDWFQEIYYAPSTVSCNHQVIRIPLRHTNYASDTTKHREWVFSRAHDPVKSLRTPRINARPRSCKLEPPQLTIHKLLRVAPSEPIH